MIERPLNVLYLIDYLASPGGTERHLAHLINRLDPGEFRCNVVPFYFEATPMSRAMQAAGAHIEYIPVAQYYRPRAFVQALKLARFIRNRHIHIVQTFHYKADVFGAIVARFAGVKHIVSSKRDAADYKRPFHFFMHRRVRAITQRYIAVSEAIAEIVARKERVPREKVATIHNGVDTDYHVVPDPAQKLAAKAALGFAPTDYVIGMSAWFRPEKNQKLLIDTVAALHATNPDVRLLLIGGGPRLADVQQYVRERNLAHLVHFTGPMEDVRPGLRALDVACLIPAMNEGFSNSVLEKMATGLPLIVTDVGGNREAIADGVNGFVIAPRDGAALQRRLAELHADTQMRVRMGAASRERAMRLFSLDAMIRQHAELYRSLMKECP